MCSRMLWRMALPAVLVLVSIGVRAGADDLDPTVIRMESRIDKVLLYSDRALVMRRGEVQVGAGKSHVALEGLPGKLFDAHVAAALLDGRKAGAAIANIEVEPVFETTFRKEEAEKATEELKALRRELRALSDRRGAVLAESKFVQGIRIGTRPEGEPGEPVFTPLAPDAWASVLDFFGEQYHSVVERERKLAEEMDDLQARIAVASARARMLLSYKTERTKRVILEIKAERPTSCELEVSYIVPDAAWFPRYDVRADLHGGKIEIIGYGLARQESGEDWEGAELAFSAAEPSQAADLPELASWRIAAEAPHQRVHWSGKKEEKALSGDIDRLNAPQPGLLTKLSRKRRRGGAAPQRLPSPAREQKADELQQTLYGLQQAATAYVQVAPQAKLSKGGRVAEQMRNIERLNTEQRKALERKDWQQFYVGNHKLQQELLYLDAAQQDQMTFLLDENGRNLVMAGRWIEANRLARGLIPPVRSSGGYDYRWRALRRESVPSDGALTKVVLFRHTFPAKFVYELAAEKSKFAFLRTKLKNATRSPFLAAPVSVFLGSDFVGESRLETCAPNEEFTVGLGADEQVAVARRVETKRDTRGVIATAYRFNVGVETTVKSGKARPVTVVVYERMPYTWDEELKVSKGTFKPKPTDVKYLHEHLEERPVLMRWELTLAPGAEKKVTVAYWFQHAADRRVLFNEDNSVTW